MSVFFSWMYVQKSKEPSPSAAPEDGTKTNGKDKEER